MRIAVHIRKLEPFSFASYRDNVMAQLEKMGCIFVPFSAVADIHNVDLIWEPGIGGSRIPRLDILKLGIPVVVTCHGASPFVLSMRENWHSLKGFIKEQLMMWADRLVWLQLKRKVAGIIAVSAFGAAEITRVFNLPADKVSFIHHGVDHEIFCAMGEQEPNHGRSYFLCVAQNQPLKNVDRLLLAYQALPETTRPDLVLIIPGYPKTITIPGVHILYDKQSAQTLANWYRGALGFVFPSLRESFGMPIIEAMACGCPVITSNNSACKEVSGDAAILLNPRDENAITAALLQLASNAPLRAELTQKGLARAQQFTWQRSAEQHLSEFKRAISETQTEQNL